MYKYQCSKNDCGTTWVLHEGRLNGFVLTCPVCGKGRGVFLSQEKRENDRLNTGTDEIIINIGANGPKTIEDANRAIEEFMQRHSLNVINKDVGSNGKETVVKIQYKVRG